MNPIELIFLMTAANRAGMAGETGKCWQKALADTMTGMSVLLANRAQVEADFARLIRLAEAKEAKEAEKAPSGDVEGVQVPIIAPTQGHIEAFGG